MTDTEQELQGTVQAYKEAIEAAAAGMLYKDRDGNEVIFDEEGDEDERAERIERENLDEITLDEYLDENALDLTFEVSQDGSLCGGRILLAWGGPGVTLTSRTIEGAWGSDRTERAINQAAQDAVWDYLEERNPAKR